MGIAAMALVMSGLVATAIVQVRPLRRGRTLLDMLAILPEWRFYAQASIVGANDLARDTHLVARDRDAAGRIGGWRTVLGHADRRLADALWNPVLRTDDPILSFGEDLAFACARGMPAETLQSRPYLVLLRRVLDGPAPDEGAIARQFAIVHTGGRRGRTLRIAFASAWHPW